MTDTYQTLENVVLACASVLTQPKPSDLGPLEPGTTEFEIAARIHLLATGAVALLYIMASEQTPRWHDFASGSPDALDPDIDLEVKFLLALMISREKWARSARRQVGSTALFMGGLFRNERDFRRAQDLCIETNVAISWALRPVKGRDFGSSPFAGLSPGRRLPDPKALAASLAGEPSDSRTLLEAEPTEKDTVRPGRTTDFEASARGVAVASQRSETSVLPNSLGSPKLSMAHDPFGRASPSPVIDDHSQRDLSGVRIAAFRMKHLVLPAAEYVKQHPSATVLEVQEFIVGRLFAQCQASDASDRPLEFVRFEKRHLVFRDRGSLVEMSASEIRKFIKRQVGLIWRLAHRAPPHEAAAA